MEDSAVIRITRDEPTEAIGARVSASLDIESVTPNTPAWHGALHKKVGWRIDAVDGHRITNPIELKQRTEGKTAFVMRVIPAAQPQNAKGGLFAKYMEGRSKPPTASSPPPRPMPAPVASVPIAPTPAPSSLSPTIPPLERLLQYTTQEIIDVCRRNRVDITRCCGKEELMTQLLTANGLFTVTVQVQAEVGCKLGLLVDPESGVVQGVVAGSVAEGKGLHLLREAWKLVGSDGECSGTDFTFSKRLHSLIFHRVCREVVLHRTSPEQKLGITFSDTLAIESVVPGGVGAAGGMADLIGWRIIAVNDKMVSSTAVLAKATAGQTTMTFKLVESSVRKVVSIEKTPSSSLGVTFSDQMVIMSVDEGSDGERAGLHKLVGHQALGLDGDVVTVDDIENKYRSCGSFDLIVGVGLRREVRRAERGKAVQRKLTLEKRQEEAVGARFPSNTLIVTSVLEGSPAWRAGLQQYIGWRIAGVDGGRVSTAGELEKAVKGKTSCTLELELRDGDLPSSILRVGMDTEYTLHQVLNAFNQFGAVAKVFPTESVETLPCPSCDQTVGVREAFCTACGGKVPQVAPFVSHVTFIHVDDAKAAKQAPPHDILPGIRSVGYYHPPEETEAPVEDLPEDVAKPSVLSMSEALGFFNAYAILGVPIDASKDEVNKAYKQKSLEYHPDKNKDGGEMFKAVAKAKRTLTDPTEYALLQKAMERAVKLYGKKVVMARIPSRDRPPGPPPTVPGGLPPTASSAAPSAAASAQPPQQNSIFTGYHSGTSVGTKRQAGYAGLKSIE
eukprot:Sspe_Gene.88965::Locus_60855_Transcript_1_1_Confidence_1.000_Length_2397::g.88965::m.88965